MKWKKEIRHRISDIHGDRFTIGLLVLGCVFCFLSTGAVSEEKTGVNINESRNVIEKWVETQRIISEEKRDLKLAKEVLNERIELVRQQIESLREKIDDAEKSIAEADKKRAEMMEENKKLKDASASLNEIIKTLEKRTKQLITRLPNPIRERVKVLSQRLPDETEQTNLSVAERFQNVVGILNEVNKFNRDITVTSEVRELPDGTSAEVTALYVGLGQAYYVGAKGNIGGIGYVSEEGWVWEPANEAASRIAQVIAILKNEQVASFIQVPIKIQ